MKSIKIGTRNSPLALWQAREVARHLQNLNYTTEIVPVVASGDKQLNSPLYQMGITGVFTRDLDQALLEGQVDLAVHSLKDVPTLLPEGLALFGYLERDYPQDVLVRSTESKTKDLRDLKLATSSLRRRAFWAEKYPNAEFTDIRGNVQTRLDKLENGIADATLFSKAGLERLNLSIEFEEVDFMLPAPGQGVVTFAGRKEDVELQEILSDLNHKETQSCVEIERAFLSTLEGGCTAPIGAYAEFIGGKIRFQGKVCSLDGSESVTIEETLAKDSTESEGRNLAERFLQEGAREIMAKIKPRL